MYSFIMPYVDRLPQYRKTVESLQRFYADREWEVILVVDAKNTDDVTLEGAPGVLYQMRRHGYNPAPMYNAGAKLAKHPRLVLTNPECLHLTNVLAEFDKHPDSYQVAMCRAESAWYAHPKHRPEPRPFCACITKENYWAMGGYDEAYADGYCFDDDDFIRKVGASDMDVVWVDATVQHQSHKKPKVPNYKRQWARNKAIFESKWGAHRG
jgi:hypothetical protein